jgi:DNA-binding NarL/FixJ family response regulator
LDDSDALRVVIAEDNYLVREGLRRLLEDSGEIDVVASTGNATELVDAVRRLSPHAVLTDIRMPPGHHMEGIEAAHAIRAASPSTGVVVLSQHADESYALALFSDGSAGLGYLLKDRIADVDAFVDAVRRVAQGGSALDPEVVSRLVGRSRRSDPLESLTPREREVLELMAQGRSNAAIAESLVVTERAVEKHVTSIFGKLDLAPAPEDHRRVLAVLTFLNS